MSGGLQSGADQVKAASDEMAAAAQAAADKVNQAQASMAQGSAGAADAFGTSAEAMQGSMDALVANISAATDAAKAEIAEMVAAMGGGTAGLAASDAIAADAAAFNSAAIARAAAAGNLSAAMAGGITSTEGLAAAESALDEAMATGAVTASEYAAIQVELGAAEDALSAQIDVNTASVAANTDAVAADTAVQGHYIGVFRILGTVMGALMSPVGAVAGGLAAVGIDAAYAQSRVDNMKDALAATGNSAGVSAGELDAWAAKIGTAVSTIGTAQTVFQQLAGSGLITGEALHAAGDAAVYLAQATGQSASAAASEVLHMESSAAAVQKLNAQFHFLTSAQESQINALYQEGNASEGAAEAFTALDAHLKQAAAQADESKSALEGLENVLERVGRSANTAFHLEFGGASLTAQIASAEHDVAWRVPGAHAHLAALEEQKKAHSAALAEGSSLALHASVNSPVSPAAITNDTRLIRDHVAAHNLTGAAATDYERQQWSGLLGEATKGSDSYATIWEKIQGLSKHHAKYVAPAGSIETATPGVMGSYDTHMMGLEAHHIAAQKHAQDIASQVATINTQSTAAHQEALLGMQKSHISAMVSMGTMGGGAAIAQEESIANQIYAIKLNELEKEKALNAQKPVEVARINSEIVRLGDSHAATMQSLSDKAAAQQIKTSESVVQPIISTFSQVTAGFVEGTLTRQQAELRLGDALVAETINTGIQMLVHHIAIEEAKTLATAAATAQRLALNIMAEAESAAIHVANAVEFIVTEAAKAAAAAFTAIAQIPFVGPVLAIGASVAAGAAVLALVGDVASAEGGWGQVPMDNAPALLHKNEMVLPAELADGVRNMSGGGGSVTNHFHIQAWDSRSMGDFVRRNPAMLAQWAQHANRTGYRA
ncbi:MAG: phage tail length tape measure family protein [Betaproteobacteria bacterium]|nr:phage tail length tape measure family protein [Betaproteobacteria bacterium]